MKSLIKTDLASEFDAFSRDYTHDMIACVPHYQKLLQCFVDYLPKNFIPQNILDIGSGTGNLSKLLCQYFPDAHYTFLDASAEMISISKAAFKDYAVDYHQSYFSDYHFPQDHFDLVVGCFSFHHCDAEEKQSLFQKIFKSLKQGGMLAMSDLMIDKDAEAHPALIQEWKDFVQKSFTNDAKWNWLMEHYDAFDKPSDYKKQFDWLVNIGFNRVAIPWRSGYWAFIQATK